MGGALLSLLGATVALPSATAVAAHADTSSIPVTVSETTALEPVGPGYLGFSIEGGNICYILSLAQSTPELPQLFKNLGSGVMRIGGSTSGGSSTWSTTGTASCARRAMVVTPALVDQFFAFAKSVGFSVMWEVPLSDDPGQQALLAQEAAYVSTEPNLYSIEFDNEPSNEPSSEYPTLIQDWDATYQDYLADGGTAPVTGPATQVSEPTYLKQFLPKEAQDLAAVTEHYYGGTAGSNPTCATLLNLQGMRKALAAHVDDGSAYHLPVYINESSTYTGPPSGTTKGAPGVSNAYCSALWAASLLLLGQQTGMAGVAFHGAVDYPAGNSGGYNEVYTPINDDGTPAPMYYGMLFYRAMTQAGGNQVAVSTPTGSAVDAYAVMGTDGKLRVALMNLTASAQTVSVATHGTYPHAFTETLMAPSLSALSGVTLGGAGVASDGTLTPHTSTITPSATLTIPAYQAVVVTYRRK